MIVRFYNLSKRVNSTRRPSGNPAAEYDCYLKEDTSIIAPVLTINTDQLSVPAWNYAYIPDFGRYYHITDIRSDGRHWYVSMACDTLATYKSQIGAFSAYVLRSASASNGRISDGFYPGISQYSVDGQSSVEFGSTGRASTPWQQSVNSGFFVLGIHAQYGSMGSIKYIAVDPANMQKLCAALSNDSVTAANGFTAIIDEIGAAMTKQLVDPLQYIKSAYWFPLPYSIFSTLPTNTSLNAGYLSFSNVSYKDITTMLFWGNLLAFPLVNHPQSSRGSYLNDAPYTERYMFAPPFGLIPINSANLQGFDYVAVNYRVDFVTGQGDLTFYGTDDPQLNNVNLSENLIGRQSAQVGLAVTMTQAVTDYVGMISGTGQAMAGAVMLSPDMLGAGLLNTLSAKMPRLQSVGGTGGLAGLAGTWRIYSVFNHIAAEHLEDIGRPLCAVRQLSTLSGFIQCRSGDVPLTGATFAEREEVKTFLENGFFWE